MTDYKTIHANIYAMVMRNMSCSEPKTSREARFMEKGVMIADQIASQCTAQPVDQIPRRTRMTAATLLIQGD